MIPVKVGAFLVLLVWSISVTDSLRTTWSGGSCVFGLMVATFVWLVAALVEKI